jgi:hypothetical protein
MSGFWWGFLWGFLFGLMVLAFATHSFRSQGYRTAYRDLHENRIEDVAKQRYPDLWIKYNIDKKVEK